MLGMAVLSIHAGKEAESSQSQAHDSDSRETNLPACQQCLIVRLYYPPKFSCLPTSAASRQVWSIKLIA